MHASHSEMWIHARAFAKRNPNHKGKRGIYRSTVTRPQSPKESRVQAFVRWVSVYSGARMIPQAKYAA